MKLSRIPGSFAVCRLAPEAEVPAWVWQDRTLLSITCTSEELSLVCPAQHVPDEIQAERGWGALKVEGPLDFALTGILAALTAPLAQAGIPLFALSTFETDYLLMKEDDLERAVQVLTEAGHSMAEK